MGRTHGALADGDRAAHDALDTERLQRRAGADDVDDGVDRPDLVELHVVGGRAVHLRFDFGEHAERGLGAVTNSLRQIGGVDQLADRPVATVVVIIVERDNAGLGGGEAAAHDVVERQVVSIEVEPTDDVGDHARVGAGIDQGCHRHVAGGAGKAVEPRRSGHFIILAIAHAAPNPLSIPTTVTPLAHEACIASSAVTPSRLAP